MSHLHLAKAAKYSLSFGFFFLSFFSFGKRSHFCQQWLLDSMILCQGRAISALSQTHPELQPLSARTGHSVAFGIGVPAGKCSVFPADSLLRAACGGDPALGFLGLIFDIVVFWGFFLHLTFYPQKFPYVSWFKFFFPCNPNYVLGQSW